MSLFVLISFISTILTLWLIYFRRIKSVAQKKVLEEEQEEISQEDCRLYKNICIMMRDQLRTSSSRNHGPVCYKHDVIKLFQLCDALLGGRQKQTKPHPHRRAEDKEATD